MKARQPTTQGIVFCQYTKERKKKDYKRKAGSKIRKVENLCRNKPKLLRLLENLVTTLKTLEAKRRKLPPPSKNCPRASSSGNHKHPDMCHDKNTPSTTKRRKLEEMWK